ncbi:MAG: metal ABC transporter substrate-binding protein [Solirubrobacteraceae bacterium MAG38_C4-C5]|nr:metal ABC transporter substrate-binding protein [Candidatus Siliceabacter maunaloa]
MSLITDQITRVALLGAATLTLGAAGCGSDDDADGGGQPAAGGGEPLEVVATTMQLQDFARQVGGEQVNVSGILGADNEPHEYEPTPSDAEALAAADVVLENGANLDDWLEDLLANAGGDAQRVTAAEGIELLPTEEEGFPGDPHIWHDPEAAKQMVDNIAAGLSAADPENAETYERNATAYKQDLDEMATQIRETFEPIPPQERKLITTHDAFGYFVRAYDLEQVGTVLPTVTTESEPSGQQVQQLVREIREQEVEAIFTEEAVDPSLERQIAEEAGAEVSSSLYADVLGGPDSGAETFIAAELANAQAMVTAWQGS